MAKRKTPLAAIESQLANLSRRDLEDLRDTINILLNALDATQTDTLTQAAAAHVPGTGKHGGSHVESKMIPGKSGKQFGPYLYARWWEGKTHKSKYIGKAETKG